MERVSDSNDLASKLEEDHKERALSLIRSRMEKVPSHFDGVHCVDCGNEIPEARRNIGAFRDIYCQQAHERKSSLYRREA